MSTTLDRVDIDYLVEQNLSAMYSSGWWARDVQGAPQAPIVAIYELGGKNLVAGSLAALGGFFCW